MSSKAQIIDDIILKATQGNPSDDHEIEREQIAYWLDVTASALITAEIEFELKNGRQIPQAYITFEECKDLEEEDVSCAGDCGDRFFVTLTGQILDLSDDSGIVRVATEEGFEISLTAVEDLSILRRLPWTRPSYDNPLAYRVGDKLYVEGFKASDAQFDKITVWYVQRQDITTLDDDDEIRLTDKIRSDIIDRVSDKLRLQLYGSQQDVQNDGIWVPQAQYHNLIKGSGNQQPPAE